MKLAWIEDLLTLAEAGTFSRAAALRNISQPAFSRRIQLLESWLDVELIDRQAQPLQLSAAAQQHLAQFRELLHDLHRLRNGIQSASKLRNRVLLVTQHSLTMTHLPPLIKLFTSSATLSTIDFNVRSENRDDCVSLFMEGHADLLLCMEEADRLLSDLMPHIVRLSMGSETLIPVSAVGPDGQALHQPRQSAVLKLLAFPPDSFLGRVMYKECLAPLEHRYQVEIVHQSVFLAGIKEMVLAGLGMAWLPASLVRRELDAGMLIELEHNLKRLTLALGLYRNAERSGSAVIDDVWHLLGSRSASGEQ